MKNTVRYRRLSFYRNFVNKPGSAGVSPVPVPPKGQSAERAIQAHGGHGIISRVEVMLAKDYSS